MCVCVCVCVVGWLAGWLAGWLTNVSGRRLWSVGSGGEILSQASNYWAEPHSKDMLLIDYTSPTSNKTKVEKPSVCVCVCV